jgi:2-polyprenyl-3-methyl-5-hydroxy-6-metoxy-1,4-benzoquinol methylase
MAQTGYLQEMATGGYDTDSVGPFHRHMIPWLLDSHGVSRDGVVVDIGAGSGHALLPLHAAGWRNLVAVDRDPANFGEFERRFGIRTVTCDMQAGTIDLPDDSVDAIVCLHVIEHLETPDNLLTEARRLLRSSGQLFLVTPDWRKQFRSFYRDPTHVRPYDKLALARLLRMHGFEASSHSWKSAYGLGRLQAYRWFPRLGMIGTDILAIGHPAP